jgi:hypothetical protein
MRQIIELSQTTGLPQDEIIKKSVRLGINIGGIISEENIQALSSLYVREKHKQFIIKPSKLNYHE